MRAPRVLGALAFTGALGLAACRDAAAPPEAKGAQLAAVLPGAPDEAAELPAEEGKRLYMNACANCHGPDGSASALRQMMPRIGDLTSAELHERLSDAELTELIARGRQQMPGFGQVFNAEQVEAIVAYTRTLKR